jgi:putative ABC transport system permease protein
MKEDIRQALRTLRKQPGFAVVVVLTLAFGIGVNTSIFTMISAFFLQPLAVPDASRLVMVMQRGAILNMPYGHSFPDYQDLREGTSVFSELTAFFPTPVHLSALGQTPERTWVEAVAPNYFALAGVTPALGQLLNPAEGEAKGTAPIVVLSYRYWQRRFGGDPALIGRTITLNGRAFTVIGVAPATFTGLSWAMAVSAWLPAGTMPLLASNGEALLQDRGAPAWRLMGRLRPGVTVEKARAEVDVAAGRIYASYPKEHKDSKALVIPESRARPDPSVADFLPVFAVVFSAMVGLVLFIACANTANLMLSRSLVRRRDLVVRAALGAGRFRLVRLQVVESVLLALAAGILGLLLAHWSGELLKGFTPAGDVPVNTEQPWDWRVYAFTFLVALVAGVASGLWPALEASRFDLRESLQESGGERTLGRRHPFRNLLVMGQVTMSLIVLVFAGLFLRSLQQMQGLALGVRTDHLLMMSLDLGMQQYDEARGRRFLDDLRKRAETLPGVRSVSFILQVPFDYNLQMSDVSIDGDIAGSKDGYLSSAFNVVGPGFFETAGTTLVRGRRLAETDDRDHPRVAVVNETMARRLWPNDPALGKRFRFGRDGEWVEVIGVAADGKYMMMGEEPRSYFYLPFAQTYRAPMTLLVWTGTGATGLATPLQEIVHGLDPDLPVYNVRTIEKHIRESVFGLMPLRMGATLAAVQGLVGLLLAVMGLYSVVSYQTAQRTREIGIRMALGAQRRDVLRLVVREGIRLTVVGMTLGLLVATGVGFGLSKVLYAIQPASFSVYAGVTLLLLGVTALACYLPARRAARIDPMAALRYQ